jgi:hypothetical protein
MQFLAASRDGLVARRVDLDTISSSVVAHCIKGIHDGFNRLIDVVWCLLVLKRLNRLEKSDIEKKTELNPTI